MVAQQVKNPASIPEDLGSIPGLAQGVKDPGLLRAVVWVAACRCSSDPAWLWLWLWCRPTAAAPIPPLAWELFICRGFGPKKKTKLNPGSSSRAPGSSSRLSSVPSHNLAAGGLYSPAAT